MVFPAQAGMNRRRYSIQVLELRVPRAGGDEPLGVTVEEAGDKCSPRRRG